MEKLVGGTTEQLVGKVYMYDVGQALVEFIWDGPSRDGYAWSPKRGQRLATYHTLGEVRAAYMASDNWDGAYGCAQLHLDPDEE